MKSTKYLLLFLTISLSTIAQTKFEKGYFINNSDQKVDCLIKNIDWKNNPTQFEYKISENDEINTGKIENIKEFKLIDIVKYIRADIDIDISQENFYYISTQREPIFKKQVVFLRILVEGINNLYVYDSEEYPLRFFYNNEKTPLQQLIYKNFHKLNEGKTIIYTNEDYKKQLYANTNCKNSKQSSIEALRYKKSEMIKYFTEINNCLGDSTIKQKYVNKKTTINFKPTLSINNSSLILDYGSGTFAGKNKMGNKINYGFGFELEFVFPYNNNNWSIAIEPTYVTTYDSEIFFNRPLLLYQDYSVKATYNNFQVPILARRSFYLNKNSKLFLNIGMNVNMASSSSEIIIKRSEPYAELDNVNLSGSTINYIAGMGFQYKKYSIEFRYYTDNDINPVKNSKDSYTYKNSSLNFKYLLF